MDDPGPNWSQIASNSTQLLWCMTGLRPWERNGALPSVPYLGRRWHQRNKAVCRCAVSSEFDRSFK